MFIIRFFTSSIFGIITGFILLGVALLVVLVAVVGALAVTGSPGDCTPGGGPMTVDVTQSDAFKQKWNGFNSVLDAGSPSAVTLTEGEISSRADVFLKQKNTPLSEPRVCLHDGSGEAQAKIKFLGLSAKFKVKGSLDLTGAHPKANIHSIEIGQVPGWLTSPARSLVNSAIDSAMNDVTLDHRYAPALKPGQAVVAGTP